MVTVRTFRSQSASARAGAIGSKNPRQNRPVYLILKRISRRGLKKEEKKDLCFAVDVI
jgi:hypothetical protein